jgi:ribosomal subunit interface protein
MTIKLTGKNLDLGDNLRAYFLDKLDNALGKHSGQPVSGSVSIEKHHKGFRTQCALHLASGLDMQSTGDGHDAYASVDGAIERLEKRMRRHRRRLKGHGQRAANADAFTESLAVDYTIEADAEPVDASTDDADHGAAPAVIAEAPIRIPPLSVGDAVMQMDLADRQFLVFRNAAHGGFNVVYRRDDGNIGWIDPHGTMTAGRR